MFRRIVACGVAAGLIAGVVAAALQLFLTVPVLQEAELYESGALSHYSGVGEAAADDHDHSDDHGGEAAAAHDHGAHDHGEGGFSRAALTALATCTLMVGFALILAAGFALAEERGVEITGRAGVLWGLGGFAAVILAPAIGLAPELPGSVAAELVSRQIWWAFAAVATAIGLGLIAFGSNSFFWILGAAVIAAPHIVGAPVPETHGGVAPPELAGLFASRVLGVGAVSWAVLGAVAGALWARDTRA